MAGNVTMPPDDRLREQLAATIESLIALLDTMEGEADQEPSLGAPEKTPRPGWHVGGEGADQTYWSEGVTDEREQEADDEDNGDREPSLGSLHNASQLGWARGRNDDTEPNLEGSRTDLEGDNGADMDMPGHISGGQGL